MATLYIIRGLPGSGKSTIARKLVHESRIREADMYHIVNGEYKYNPDKVKAAHEWCLNEMKHLMTEPADCAVANTFTRRWEYQPYIKAAKSAGFYVQVIDCFGPWRNIHGVPEHVIKEMKNRWKNHVD
jgi:predicted ABC-type ATPase